jgi:hypothetical protein
MAIGREKRLSQYGHTSLFPAGNGFGEVNLTRQAGQENSVTDMGHDSLNISEYCPKSNAIKDLACATG